MDVPANAFTYMQIGTPNLLDEINRLILKRDDVQILGNQWSLFSPEKKVKFQLLAERIEFIDNLEILRKAISKKQTIKHVSSLLIDPKTVDRKIFWECKFLGHDFAGVNFDIAAIQIYLLITCVDTITGQPEYVEPFSWLVEKMGVKETIMECRIKELADEYKKNNGLNRFFKQAFRVAVSSSDLAQKWIDSYCCVTIDAPVGRSAAQINKESWDSWDSKSNEKKLDAIAAQLYEMRSKYTHCSMREFERDLPVKRLPVGRKKHLVRIGVHNIYSLLHETVLHIAERFWDNDFKKKPKE